MGELHLPGGLTLPTAGPQVQPRIKCARSGCDRTTERRIRAEDNPIPAPADAGWYEIEIDGTRRTVLFACSAKCAQAVAAVQVPQNLTSAMPDAPGVLPE